MRTVYMLTPLTDSCKDWIKNNVNFEPWQVMVDSVTVEARYIQDIVRGLNQEGYELDQDFRVM